MKANRPMPSVSVSRPALLTSDGRWNYTWDAENRLIRLVANNAVAPQQRIDFEYDWQGRRISKKVWNNTAGSGNPVVHSKFLYDGWNLCAEIDGLNPQPRTLIRSYVWGIDLSGSLEGAGLPAKASATAGGVGGLVKFIYHATQSTNFVTYDGNGNVAALFDASNNALLASYEYGPFGELIRATGPTVGSMAKLNPIRFSTKYQDDETDLLYYGYRYYSPSMGRWLSRDPVGERGALNVYNFTANTPISTYDILGLVLPLPPLPLPPIVIIPIVVPGPVLGSKDTLPGNFSGFAICQRPLQEDSCLDRFLNRCGQGHKFIASFSEGTPTEGYGFYPSGKVSKEVLLTCPRGKGCERTDRPLKYGTLGAGKTGKSASDEDILDCLKNRPPLGSYKSPFNDCRHWAARAATDCGLDCGQ